MRLIGRVEIYVPSISYQISIMETYELVYKEMRVWKATANGFGFFLSVQVMQRNFDCYGIIKKEDWILSNQD